MDRRKFIMTASALGLTANAIAESVKWPKGPLPWKTLLELSRWDVPTLSNTIERFELRPRNKGFMRPEIRCLFPDLGPIVGYAVTAKTISVEPRKADSEYGRSLDFFDYIVSVPPPRIVVIEDLDDPPGVGSYWGEIHATQHQLAGCVATVTNGGARDLPEVERIGFQVFAQHVIVSHAFCHVVEFGKTLELGGMEVRSGDLLHGDQHGVLQIPIEIASELPNAARKERDREFELLDQYRTPGYTYSDFREALARR